MSTQQASVQELQEYWKYVESLKTGDILEDYIALVHMPPWDEICSYMDWRHYAADAGYFSNRRHGFCGVYRIVGLISKGGNPATINRVGGEDRSGTLYIGEASNLSRRLNQFRRTLRGKEVSHDAGRRLRFIPSLKGQFTDKLAVALLHSSIVNTKYMEQTLLEAYTNSFGDRSRTGACDV